MILNIYMYIVRKIFQNRIKFIIFYVHYYLLINHTFRTKYFVPLSTPELMRREKEEILGKRQESLAPNHFFTAVKIFYLGFEIIYFFTLYTFEHTVKKVIITNKFIFKFIKRNLQTFEICDELPHNTLTTTKYKQYCKKLC